MEAAGSSRVAEAWRGAVLSDSSMIPLNYVIAHRKRERSVYHREVVVEAEEEDREVLEEIKY